MTASPGKRPDIVYSSLFPWDNAFFSVSLALTKYMPPDRRVFYVNRPYSAKDVLLGFRDERIRRRARDAVLGRVRYERIPGLGDHVTGVHPPMTWPINAVPPGRVYERLRRFNERIVLRAVRRVTRDHALTGFIHLNCFNPYYAGVLPPSSGAILNAYQCVDDMSQEPYTARHGARLEKEVVRTADVVFVTSRNLYRIHEGRNPNIHLVPNGVDHGVFAAAASSLVPPPEIADVDGKIVAFMGNMDRHRIDYDLLVRVAQVHRNKTVLLIGPFNGGDEHRRRLERIPNVILTGAKRLEELPAYLERADCTLLPFRCNRLTASIYPIKVNEYLAAGRPVVSTSFSEDIGDFSESVYLAGDPDEFVRLIDKAIDEDDPVRRSRRREVARANTWAVRAEEIGSVLDEELRKLEGRGQALLARSQTTD